MNQLSISSRRCSNESLTIRSFIVNHLDNQAAPETAMAFVYCDYKESATHFALGLLRSVARQLAACSNVLLPEVKVFYDTHLARKCHPTEDDWVSLIRSVSRCFKKAYVFVDAIVSGTPYFVAPLVGLTRVPRMNAQKHNGTGFCAPFANCTLLCVFSSRRDQTSTVVLTSPQSQR